MDTAISEAEHSQRTLAQNCREAQVELTDFIRTAREIEHIVEDLEAAGARPAGNVSSLKLRPCVRRCQICWKWIRDRVGRRYLWLRSICGSFVTRPCHAP